MYFKSPYLFYTIHQICQEESHHQDFFNFFLANIGDFSNLRYWQCSFKIPYKFFFFLFNTFFVTFFLNIVFNMASKIILPYVPLVIVLNTKSDAVVITILKPPWLRVLTQQNLLVYRRFCLYLL